MTVARRAVLSEGRGPWRFVICAGALSLALGACGGSNQPAASPGKSPTTSTTAGSGGGSTSASAVSTGPVHAQLTGQTHHPAARKNWSYTVTATDAHGRPLAGTTLTEFTFQGAVVGKETPAIHKLRDGRVTDVLQFPPDAVGNPIELQVVVHTNRGSVTLRWPVMVRK